MLRKDCGGAATMRVCGLNQTEAGWLSDHGGFDNGIMKVWPPVIDAQPARWLAAQRWLRHCYAQPLKKGKTYGGT